MLTKHAPVAQPSKTPDLDSVPKPVLDVPELALSIIRDKLEAVHHTDSSLKCQAFAAFHHFLVLDIQVL